MNRQTRTIAVLVIAIAIASAASYAVYQTVKRIPVQKVEVSNYKVVVAARPLGMGAQLTEADLKLVAWPSSSPVPTAHSDIKEVLNRGLLSAILENEPVTESKLAPLEAGAGLSPTIPQGMRAMSVKVNEVVGVAGFVVPGTRVDVVVTLRRAQDSMTKTVLSNVQVLTAGTRYDQEKARNGQPIPSTVVTLMVSPEDGERVALAQSQGEIMLALRNPLDTTNSVTSGARVGTLFGGPAVPQPESDGTPKPRRVALAPRPLFPPVVLPAVARPYTVEAIRGAKRTTEEIKQEVIR
jgi:pilus assembly protein CpaB